jgi:cytochrome c biogenesis protein CcdA/thiol-disulfide isomerase/thioredoxin
VDVILATLFALVAGAGTALSPCVLPVLPLALSGAATGGHRRPLGIAVGLAAAFAFTTLALAYVLDALGLPDDVLRVLAIAVMLGFGIALVLPPVAARLEYWSSRVVRAHAVERGDGDGFASGLVLGASLGVLYVPCAGPVLAAVLTVQASQPLTSQRLVTGIAYAIGTAAAVLVILTAGRRLLGRLRANAGRLQQAMGVVMIAFAVLTLSGVDGRFRTAVADHLPGFLVSPTASLEERAVASDRKPLGRAPEIEGTQRWFNSDPLTLRELRGHVVLIDFWTYTCINCIRTLPHLKAWDAAYRDRGLTIIGVHSPEFPFEKDAGNVERAVREQGIRYPVAQDNDFTVWKAYGNRYWPAKYLVDARGRVRYVHFGEGEYDETEDAIRDLLAEAGERSMPAEAAPVRGERAAAGVSTPETYLGSARAQGFTQDPILPGGRDFGPLPSDLPQDAFAFGGAWRVEPESAEALARAQVATRFGARRVFLVLGARERGSAVRVLLDGRPIPDRLAGADVHGGVVRVGEQRLYRLVDLPRAESHRLTLDLAPGVRAYAFTFG